MQPDKKISDLKRKEFITAIWGKFPTKESLKSFPVISILISNILIAVFALIENQSVLNILWVYWFQSVIIGVFNFVKILSLKNFTVDDMKMNNKPLANSKSAKLGVGIFFLVHYGIFHAVYAGFLFSFSSTNVLSSRGVDPSFILLTSLVFFANYLGEFIFSLRSSESTVYSLPKVMMAPYKRIIPMHLTIILSGFVMAGSVFGAIDLGFIVLLIFLALKSFIDLFTHA